MTEIVLDYEPQPKQQILHGTDARLILYGGAVGGGKSHCLRWEGFGWCLQIPGIQVYLFRRTLPELEKNHIRTSRAELPRELAVYNDKNKVTNFHNGSALHWCYCEKEFDVERYQGTEIHVLLVDEAAHLTEYQLNYLIGRNRLGKFRFFLEEKYPKWRPKLPRAAFGSNPGGPGHSFLKECFIDQGTPGEIFHNPKYRNRKDPEDEGRLSIFIPARMDDNLYIDDDYAASLEGLAPELRKALTEGDWDAVVGQALPIERGKHMIRPFTPPRHWTHFMSLDWGTARPFSIGWYCISDGALLKGKDGWPDVYLSEGCIVRYDEYYGWDGRADIGCRKDSKTVARDIVRLEEEKNFPPMDYRVADSQMWAQHDGPSPQENMYSVTAGRIALRQAKKDRERNYDEFLCRLAGNPRFREDGVQEEWAMFFCTSNCRHFWRTVPILTLDPVDPNKGPWDKLENHAYDEAVFALRSRPYVHTTETRDEEEFRTLERTQPRKSVSRYAT